MTEALAFWGVAMVIGALALPIAFRLFRGFPDYGAGLSVTLGLTLLAAGYFLLRVIGVLPAGRGSFLLAILLLGIAGFVVVVSDRRFFPTLRRALPGIAVTAALFSTLFFGYAFFRAYVPDIAHTEQPMDFLYLNAMLVSPEFPPHDPWLAGETASYHYGGYLQAAILTGAADVWPASGYNLALAAVFASAGAAAASLAAALALWFFGRNARRWVIGAGAGAVLLLLFAGPLASVFEFASAHGAANEAVFNVFGTEGLVRCGSSPDESCTGRVGDLTTRWYPDDHWVWWRMSRMAYWGPQPSYPFTVTESPSFSFLLGDLHPHVMAIPGVLLALAAAAALWRGSGALSWRSHRRRPALLLCVAVVFGSLAFVNVWDVITFSPVLALAVLARNWREGSPLLAVVDTVSWLVAPAVLAVILFAPWWVGFSPENGGIYAYGGGGTRIEHALLMWGVGIVFALPVVGWVLGRVELAPLAGRFRRPRWSRFRWQESGLALLRPTLALLRLTVAAPRLARANPSFALALVPVLVPVVVWIVLAAFDRTAAPFESGEGLGAALGARMAGAWLTLCFYALVLWLLTGAAITLNRRNHPATPVAVLAALGVFLLYATELLLLRDILFFIPRLNTVFKLSYQAWILLSVAGAVGVVAGIRAAPPRYRLRVAVPVVVLLGASLVFAVTNTPNRAGDFDVRVGLDGLRYIERLDAGEYELVRWLNDNADRDAIVVEATGRIWLRGEDGRPTRGGADGSYGSAGRVGYRTGLQTPIGWPGHERTWRGATDELNAEIDRRQDLVDRVYTAASPAEVLDALHQLGATYVVVGSLERSHYRDGLIPPFETFLDTVFTRGGVTVFRIPTSEVVTTR